jgi:hypothetical protein
MLFLTYYAFMFAICIRTWIFWNKYTQSFMSYKVVSNKYYFWKTRKYTECWFQRRLQIYNLFISLTKNANLTNFLPYVSNRIFCTSTFDYIKDTFSVLTLFIISNKTIFPYFLTPHQVCTWIYKWKKNANKKLTEMLTLNVSLLSPFLPDNSCLY